MTTTTTRRTARGVAAGLAALLAVGTMSSSALAVEVTEGPYAGRTAIDQGHVDYLYLTKAEGVTRAEIHATSGALAVDDVVLHVKPSVATRTVGAATSTLPGFPAQGASYFLMPQSNQPGQIFAGYGYDHAALHAGTSVTWNLTAFDGPGALVLWESGEEAPVVLLGSTAGAPTSFTSAADHAHANWGFTAEGAYTLTLAPTVTEPSATAQVLPALAYTIFVGETLPGGTIDPDPDPDPDPAPSTVLTVSGLAHHYHAGQVATLTAVQTPQTDEDHYHWFTRAPGSDEWVMAPGALTGTYGRIVSASDEGVQVKAVLYSHEHTVIAESEPAVLTLDDHGNTPVTGPTITATLGADQGSLAISVAPENRTVDLGSFTMGTGLDRWVATGDLLPITVTDTRAGDQGWSASGRVRGFTTVDGVLLDSGALGWAPTVLGASAGQQVVAGPEVPSVLSGGTGIKSWKVLATAAAGSSMGTAQLGAGLTLEAPTTLDPGTYIGQLILTVI